MIYGTDAAPTLQWKIENRDDIIEVRELKQIMPPEIIIASKKTHSSSYAKVGSFINEYNYYYKQMQSPACPVSKRAGQNVGKYKHFEEIPAAMMQTDRNTLYYYCNTRQ